MKKLLFIFNSFVSTSVGLFADFPSFLGLLNRVFNRVFNRLNFTKVFIIFVLGFLSRGFVNAFFDVNVFFDFTNSISLTYYFSFSIFIVILHDLIELFQFSIIPSFAVLSDYFRLIVVYSVRFITFFFSFIGYPTNGDPLSVVKAFSYLFSIMPRVSSDAFNLSSIRKSASIYFRGDYRASHKMPIGGFSESNVDCLDIGRVKSYNALMFDADPSKTLRGKNLAATNPQGETLLPRRYNPSASNTQRFNHSGSNPQSGTNPHSGSNQLGINLTDSQNNYPGDIEGGKKLNASQRFKQNSKRRFFWIVWGIHSDKHKSYEDFKQTWNPNTKMWYEIKNDIKNETNEFVHKLTLQKRTLSWILNRRK